MTKPTYYSSSEIAHAYECRMNIFDEALKLPSIYVSVEDYDDLDSEKAALEHDGEELTQVMAALCELGSPEEEMSGDRLLRVPTPERVRRLVMALEARVAELEGCFIRTCPPGTCKVQAPNPCTCLVAIQDIKRLHALLILAYDELNGYDVDKPRGTLLAHIADAVSPVGWVGWMMGVDVQWAREQLKL